MARTRSGLAILTALVLASAASTPVLAQDPPAPVTTDDMDDDGFDWGWLGLLGLAGLYGLKGRDRTNYDTTRRT